MTSKGYKELPVKVKEALSELQRGIQGMQNQANAMLFAVRQTMGVPDDWQFDGKGFKEPEEPKKEGGK